MIKPKKMCLCGRILSANTICLENLTLSEGDLLWQWFCRGVNLLGTCAFQQAILLVCAQTCCSASVCACLRFLCMRIRTHCKTISAMCLPMHLRLFSNLVTYPCECAMCNAYLRLSLCVSPSLAYSCPPSLTTSFLSPYLPPSLCPIQ